MAALNTGTKYDIYAQPTGCACRYSPVPSAYTGPQPRTYVGKASSTLTLSSQVIRDDLEVHRQADTGAAVTILAVTAFGDIASKQHNELCQI